MTPRHESRGPELTLNQTTLLLSAFIARRPEAQGILMFVLPALVSVSFLLIADIDSPRGGFIRVKPQNLVSFAQTLEAP
jgi:hypothetical protein